MKYFTSVVYMAAFYMLNAYINIIFSQTFRNKAIIILNVVIKFVL